MKSIFSVRLVLFLGLFAWRLEAAVDPCCVRFAQNDLFLGNLRFFRDFLLAPGDPAEWLTKAVLQACYFGWPGTLIFAVIVGLILISTMVVMRRISARDANVAWMVPALILITFHSRYDYPISASVSAAIAMVATAGFGALADWQPTWRLAAFTALSALVYYLVGAAFYVFASCVLIVELYRGCAWWTKIAWIVAAFVVRFLVDAILGTLHPGWFFLHAPITGPFVAERSLGAMAVALYACFPLIALLLADRAARRRSEPGAATLTSGEAKTGEARAEQSVLKSKQYRGLLARLWPGLATAAFLAAAWLAGWTAARPDLRTVLALHDCADRERWDEVLELGKQVSPDWYSQFVVHDVNMTLHRLGRMPYDMFLYRQFVTPVVVTTHAGPHATAFLDAESLSLRKLGEFHYYLGRLNDAEYYVHESFVRHPSAECLRQLARIALAKNELEQARLFFNVLRDDLVYGGWANAWLSRLSHSRGLDGDDEINAGSDAGIKAGMDAEMNAVRARRLTEEDIHVTASFLPNPIIAGRDVSTRKQIASSLHQNPRNRVAFEYLMAGYLVEANVVAAAELFPVVASFDYPAPPSVYEEAAMIHARLYERREVTDGPFLVGGRAISEETLSKIRQLDAILGPGPHHEREVARVAREVGLTYFHFYYYGRWGD